MAEVFTIAAAIRPQYRALVLLAAFSRLRWGELLALTRRDLDMEAATVRVSASMIEVDDALSLGPPKSRAGQRTVAFPRQLLGELALHLEKGPRGDRCDQSDRDDRALHDHGRFTPLM